MYCAYREIPFITCLDASISVTITEIKQLSLEQVALVAFGYCPYCELYIENWNSPSGMSFSPEFYSILREKEIDPKTGHKIWCNKKEIAL